MSYQPETKQPFRWHYADFDDSNFQIRGRTLFFAIVVFSAILLITLLFIYARWVCRFGSPPLPLPTTAPSSPSTSHVSMVNPMSRGGGGLDAAAINNFPITLHKSPSEGCGEAAECCICLGLFADGEKVKVLPQCHHCFHSDCVDKWLATQSSCPLCRDSLRADSLV